MNIYDDDKGGYMSCYEAIHNDKDGWAICIFCILIILFLLIV
jgi:hypothetical protein